MNDQSYALAIRHGGLEPPLAVPVQRRPWSGIRCGTIVQQWYLAGNSACRRERGQLDRVEVVAPVGRDAPGV